MLKAQKLTMDPSRGSLAEAIRAAAGEAALLVLSDAALRQLAMELDGGETVGTFLVSVATEVGRPIGVNLDRGDGESSTACIAPKGWTQERLKSWIAGRHEAIEAMFGPATPVALEDL